MRLIKNCSIPLVFIFAAFMAWDIAVRISSAPSWLLPTPGQVFVTLKDSLPLLYYHAQSTVLAALVGLLAAVAVALLMSFLMALSPFVKQGVYPLIVISQTIPIIAVAPLFIIWFGYGILPKVVVVALVCFFPVAVSMVEGMDAADPEMVNMLQVMGASPWQAIKLVRLPAALPSFFAGLKIAATYAIMGAVIGEWLGATKGLGLFMTRASHAYRLSSVLAAVAVISFISLIMFFLVETLARLFMPWYYRRKGENYQA